MKKSEQIIKKIALERIYRLFDLAEKEFEKHKERSNRYIELAWNISLKYRIRMPLNLRAFFCRKCKHYLKKNKNCEIIELKDLGNKLKLIEVHCFDCGYKRKMKVLN